MVLVLVLVLACPVLVNINELAIWELVNCRTVQRKLAELAVSEYFYSINARTGAWGNRGAELADAASGATPIGQGWTNARGIRGLGSG